MGLHQSTVGPFLDVYQFHVAFIGFGNLVQETEDPVSTGQAHDDRVELHADLGDGHVEALIKGQEAGQAAQGEATHSAQGQDTAQNGAEDVADVAQLGGDRHEHAGEGVGVLGALEEGLVAPGELLHVFLLVAEDLDHLLALHHLLDKAVEAAQVFLLGHKVPARQTGELLGGEENHRHHGQSEEGQGDAEHDHGHQDADHGDGAVEQLGHALADHLAQGVNVVGVDGHDVPVGMGVKIPDGEGLHVLEHLIAQVPQGPLGDIDHHPGLEQAGQHAAGVEEGHPGDGVDQAGEVGGAAGLDGFHQGQDIAVDEGLGEQGALDHGQDTDHNGNDHHDQVEPILFPHKPQHPPQGLHGVLQLGFGAPASGARYGSCLFCHQ